MGRPVSAGQQQDIVLTRVTAPYAGTGRRVPGPYAEAGTADIVLGNELVAMAVANGFEDPQLPGATRGRPVDLAAVGRLDQLDWLHLPYVSRTEPTGTEAWQQGLVVASTVEVDGTAVRVRAAGGGLEAVTTYSPPRRRPRGRGGDRQPGAVGLVEDPDTKGLDSPYLSAYYHGWQLLDAVPERPDVARRLLTEQVLPIDLDLPSPAAVRTVST